MAPSTASRWPWAIGASAANVSRRCLLPYIRAEQAGELYRTIEPTAAVRAESGQLSPLERPWPVYEQLRLDAATVRSRRGRSAFPVLVGLACARLEGLRRHAPLVARWRRGIGFLR